MMANGPARNRGDWVWNWIGGGPFVPLDTYTGGAP